MKHIKIADYLSVEELHMRFDQATRVVERNQWQVLWLAAQDRSAREIAQITGYSEPWVYNLIHRYNAEGPDGMGDRREQNPGQSPLVPPEVRAELAALLDDPAPDGGLWTSAKVAEWLSKRLGRPIHPQRGWELLRALGYRPRVPRPHHAKADPEAQQEWKETKLSEEVARIQADHPDATTWELWTMDEHRIGRKPILRRVWVPAGTRPTVTVQPRYEWQYLYGFVCPETGATFWIILPRVSTDAFSQVLQELATFLKLGAERQIILVLDRAGWHTSGKLVVPAGMHLVFQPAYSPEVQPAERLWALTDEALANQHFDTLDDLVEAQSKRCETLQGMPEVIRARTNFYWWPEVAGAA